MKKIRIGNKTKLILTKKTKTPWVAKITGLDKDGNFLKLFLDTCHINKDDYHFLCDEGYYECNKTDHIEVRKDGSWKNVDWKVIKENMMISL